MAVNSETGKIEVQAAPTYEYVDLGLPSGTLWAKCNVGAETETDYGLKFAWGETEPKSSYSWSNYKWGTAQNLTKYNSTDGKTVLDLEDDAAHVNMGGDWRMPTIAEMDELFGNTNHHYTENYNDSGKDGEVFTKNGQTLFIPKTNVPTSSLLIEDKTYAEGWYINRWDGAYPNARERYEPLYVRGVLAQN